VRPALLLDENYQRRPKNAAEQGVTEQEALQKGMGERSRNFVEKGSELYAKAKGGQDAATPPHPGLRRVSWKQA